MRLRNEIELCGFFQRHSSSIRPSNPGRTLSKVRHPLRSRKAAPACAKQNGYCCARALRRAFAHNLCAQPLLIFYFPYLFFNLWLGHCHGRFQCCTRGGSGAAPEGVSSAAPERGSSAAPEGVKMAGATPPVCALRAALTPGCNAHHVGQCLPPYGGGRSRHNDPCGKARIAEG